MQEATEATEIEVSWPLSTPASLSPPCCSSKPQASPLVNLELVRNLRAQGNLGYACGIPPGEEWAGWFRFADPRLRRADDGLGLWRLADASAAIDAAVEDSPTINDDVFGRTRSGRRDIGAEEFGMEAILRRPLTSGDVGPDAP